MVLCKITLPLRHHVLTTGTSCRVGVCKLLVCEAALRSWRSIVMPFVYVALPLRRHSGAPDWAISTPGQVIRVDPSFRPVSVPGFPAESRLLRSPDNRSRELAGPHDCSTLEPSGCSSSCLLFPVRLGSHHPGGQVTGDDMTPDRRHSSQDKRPDASAPEVCCCSWEGAVSYVTAPGGT